MLSAKAARHAQRHVGLSQTSCCRPLAQAGEGADFVDGWEPRSSWKCFKCGKPGHFANSCPGLGGHAAQVKFLPTAGAPPLPCSPVHATVQGTWGQGELAVESSCHQTNSTLFSQAGFGEGRGEGPATTNAPGNVQQAAPAEPLQAAATTSCSGLATGLSEAVAGLVRDACEPECPDTALAELLRSVFKHKNFRGPQLGVIRRVLRGESTLAILPTGALSPNPSLHAAAQ